MVRVEALCATGLAHSEAYTIISDSAEVTVESLYTIPSSNMIYNLFTFDAPYGIVPSYECQPTGKLQVHIERGTFPYTINLWRCTASDTLLIRSIVFDTTQQSGDTPFLLDYRNYYTIDSLEAGDYKLICHDGCGYYMPSLYATVPKVKYNIDPNRHLMRNSSGIPRSHNIIVFKEIFNPGTASDHNDDYYYYINGETPMLQYRFINPTPDGARDTIPWRQLPRMGSGSATLYDTMASVSSYCEAWFDTIQFQIRHLPCSDTLLNYNFVLYPQNNTHYFYNYSSKRLTDEISYYDLCKHHFGGYSFIRFATKRFYYHYSESCSANAALTACSKAEYYTAAGGITDMNDGMRRHNYITLPVHGIRTDLNRQQVLDTINSSIYTYDWYVVFPVDSSVTGDSILVEIYDDKGCPLKSDLYVSTYDAGVLHTNSNDQYYEWQAMSPISNRCNDLERGVGLEQPQQLVQLDTIYGQNVYSYFGDTIYLAGSPDSNFYNFRAYIDTMEHYYVEKTNPGNLATVAYEEHSNIYGMRLASIVVKGDHLPPGEYTWVIAHACDRPNDTIVQNVSFYDIPEVNENPEYTFTRRCTQLEIVPQAGQFALGGTSLSTFFQVHREDTLVHSVNSVRAGQPMYVGMPGSYILSMYALPMEDGRLLSDYPCYVKDTVIVWDGATIEFDYLLSYVCNDRDSMGFVHARGKNGTLPYTYTLYDAPNGTGNIIGQNHIGDFDTLATHYGQALSIEMTDGCDAHFLTNFTVSDLEKIRKGWAENEFNTLSLCGEGVCHFYGIALGEVSYHWTGPDGFESFLQNPELHITSDSHPGGTYQVEVLGTGCGPLRDSIRLEILAHADLELSRDTSVCAGETVPIVFTPHGVGPFSYTIIRQAGTDTVAFLFTSRPAHCSDTLFETVVKDSVRYFVAMLTDEGCGAGVFSDTVTVTMLGSGTNDTLARTIDEEDLPYFWDGYLFTQGDTMTVVLANRHGCDSSVTRILTVIPAPAVEPVVYGPCPEAVDYDGYHYPSVRIDHYCWTQVNLRSRHYSDGREIVTPMSYHSEMYPDSVGNVDIFGHLYSWYAAIDTAHGGRPTAGGHYQGICPEGWFLPDSIHYAELSLHGAPALRSPLLWINGSGGDNSTGFTALPAGFFNGSKLRYENLLGETRFWSTYHDISSKKACTIEILYYCLDAKMTQREMKDGCSIRCILEE